jgi:hypothetical protein
MDSKVISRGALILAGILLWYGFFVAPSINDPSSQRDTRTSYEPLSTTHPRYRARVSGVRGQAHDPTQGGKVGFVGDIVFDTDNEWMAEFRADLIEELESIDSPHSLLARIEDILQDRSESRESRLRRGLALLYLPVAANKDPDLRQDAIMLLRLALSGGDKFVTCCALVSLYGVEDSVSLSSIEPRYSYGIIIGPVDGSFLGLSGKQSLIDYAKDDRELNVQLRTFLEDRTDTRIYVRTFALDAAARLGTDQLVDLLSGLDFSEETFNVLVQRTLFKNRGTRALDMLAQFESQQMEITGAFPYASPMLAQAGYWNARVATRARGFLDDSNIQFVDRIRSAEYLGSGLSFGHGFEEIDFAAFLRTERHPLLAGPIFEGIGGSGRSDLIPILRSLTATPVSEFRNDVIKDAMERLGYDHGGTPSITGQIRSIDAEISRLYQANVDSGRESSPDPTRHQLEESRRSLAQMIQIWIEKDPAYFRWQKQ